MEAPPPSGLWTTLASIGTISFFLEATVYGFLGLLGYSDPIQTVLVPILGIFGYAGLVDAEERLLTAKFGDEYLRYAEATGRFTPRLPRDR